MTRVRSVQASHVTLWLISNKQKGRKLRSSLPSLRGLVLSKPPDRVSLDGAAPYWRAALQQNWQGNYFALGHYGMSADVFPGRDKAILKPTAQILMRNSITPSW